MGLLSKNCLSTGSSVVLTVRVGKHWRGRKKSAPWAPSVLLLSLFPRTKSILIILLVGKWVVYSIFFDLVELFPFRVALLFPIDHKKSKLPPIPMAHVFCLDFRYRIR